MNMVEKMLKIAKSKGISNIAIADACNLTRSTINNWKSTNGYVPSHHLKTVCDLLEITPNVLFNMRDDSDGDEVVIIDEVNQLSSDKISLPINKRAFSKNWLSQQKLNPNYLRLFRVRGDAMKPIIQDKDLVLLDIKSTPTNTRPVVFRLDGDIYCKNYQHQGNGKVQFISNNKIYPDITIDTRNDKPTDFKIMGTVVWFSHCYL